MPSSLKRLIWPFAAFAVLLLVWELYTHLFLEKRFVLPSPSGILASLWNHSDRFWWHARATIGEMAGGCLIAFCAAFPLAWIMLSWENASFILQPFFVMIQCIPMFALAPLMIMWFGWSYTAIIVPTALMVFFPLTMNIYQGLRSTPQHLIDYFRIQDATEWQLFYKLRLPWALPHLFGGFRISAGIAGIGAIAGEWAGAQHGLGVLMLESRRATDLEITFGALFWLAAISVIFYSSILMIENLFVQKYFRKASVVIKALVALLLLGGCQESNRSQEVRLLLDWLPNPNHVPLYVGIEKGFFQSNGIPLKILKINDPSDTVPFLTSGQAELALYYAPNIIRAIHRNAQIKPIAILIDQPLNAFIYRTNEGIASPSDLNGKRIGYCVDGTDKGMLDYLLQSNHIKPSLMRNVTFDLVASLGQGHVDVIYGAYWNIECEHLRALGIDTDYFPVQQLGHPPYPELVLIAREGSIHGSEDFMRRLQKGLEESIAFSILHPEEAFQIYIQANPDKSLKTIEWERKAWERTVPALARSQKIKASEWNTLKEWMTEHKMLR